MRWKNGQSIFFGKILCDVTHTKKRQKRILQRKKPGQCGSAIEVGTTLRLVPSLCKTVKHWSTFRMKPILLGGGWMWGGLVWGWVAVIILLCWLRWRIRFLCPFMRGSRGRGGLGRIMVGLMMMSLSVTLGILLVVYKYVLLFMYGLQWRGVQSSLQPAKTSFIRVVTQWCWIEGSGGSAVQSCFLRSPSRKLWIHFSWVGYRCCLWFVAVGGGGGFVLQMWWKRWVSLALRWWISGWFWWGFWWFSVGGACFLVTWITCISGRSHILVGLVIWLRAELRSVGVEALSDVASLHALWCGLMVDGLVFPWWLGREDRITRRRLGLWRLGHFTRSCGIMPFYLELWLISFFIWCSALWLRQPEDGTNFGVFPFERVRD